MCIFNSDKVKQNSCENRNETAENVLQLLQELMAFSIAEGS